MLQSYSKLTAGGDVKLLCHGTYKMYDGNILVGGELDIGFITRRGLSRQQRHLY